MPNLKDNEIMDSLFLLMSFTFDKNSLCTVPYSTVSYRVV